MILSVGCTLGYEVQFPTANFTSNILANRDPFQHVVDEGIRLTADLAIGERTATSKGNRVFRVEAPAGMFEVTYRAMMEVRRPSVPAEVRIDNPGRLPLSIPTYMLSSGYCESDRFSRQTWDLFGKISNRADQVREICRWVDAKLVYTPSATDSRTSAWDVWQLKRGGCSDYTRSRDRALPRAEDPNALRRLLRSGAGADGFPRLFLGLARRAVASLRPDGPDRPESHRGDRARARRGQGGAHDDFWGR
jgi:hypothetical protein